MLKNKYTKYVANFLISWFGLCFIFPHISGITYTGSIFEGLGLTFLNLLILIAAVVIAIIAMAVCGLIFEWLDSQAPDSPLQAQAEQVRQGFWKVMLVGSAMSILLSSLTWKITAGFSSSLEINGWLPIIIGTTITSLIACVPKYLARPNDYTEARFRAELSAPLANEQAGEAAKQEHEQEHEHKDGETK